LKVVRCSHKQLIGLIGSVGDSQGNGLDSPFCPVAGQWVMAFVKKWRKNETKEPFRRVKPCLVLLGRKKGGTEG
jgi:hypothetical protein